MKVTVDSKDLNRLINFLPAIKELFTEDREAVIRIIGSLSQTPASNEHEVYINNGNDRVNAIRFMRALFGFGLKEAKDITDVLHWNTKSVGIVTGSLDLPKSLAKDYNIEVTFKPV